MSCYSHISRACGVMPDIDTDMENVRSFRSAGEDADGMDVEWSWLTLTGTLVVVVFKGSTIVNYFEADDIEFSHRIELELTGLYSFVYRREEAGVSSPWAEAVIPFTAGETGEIVTHNGVIVLDSTGDVVVHNRVIRFLMLQNDVDALLTNHDDPDAPGTKFNLSV